MFIAIACHPRPYPAADNMLVSTITIVASNNTCCWSQESEKKLCEGITLDDIVLQGHTRSYEFVQTEVLHVVLLVLQPYSHVTEVLQIRVQRDVKLS